MFVENTRWQPNLSLRWCGTEVNAMVWDRGSDTLVEPTRWDLLGVALGRAPVWPCGKGVGFTEKSSRKRLCVTYRQVKMLIIYQLHIHFNTLLCEVTNIMYFHLLNVQW